ncbi:protein of unknown function DUF1818 [Gloeocapsa sp. PCC 7428]|uniref:DUF1818 family protein n=1 Tax=Gloeocapsa sp. PCC 7428 TaxID=1173026 RepID=UPI0002A611F3|nr:DUF1818 family protein [Gloeocapsa sp. PCC 7428]AFZ31186.1 protein of unknown function DUF1818 [Gloeocapsa sp. PCC 7428]
MERVVKSGTGWRVGWNPHAAKYQALIGTDDWAIELTSAEFYDFCRLAVQLTEAIAQISQELMDEEKISCEAESDLVWMEVTGYPHAYSLHFILHTGRGVEGTWTPQAVPHLIQAVQMIQVF